MHTSSRTRLLAAMISIVLVSFSLRDACAVDLNTSKKSAVENSEGGVRQLELAIADNRGKIIDESKIIAADRRKLKEAEKLGDKINSDILRQGIAAREAAIKKLKSDISNMKDRKNELVYGEQFIPTREDEVRQ